MTFIHPLNHHAVAVKAPRFWTFLFGPLYFAAHGVWTHAVISAVVAMCTFGLTWLIHPWFSPGIMRRAYLAKGWREDSPVDMGR